MKRLIATVAAVAAPLFVLGAAAPAEAHCKCEKPGHHAKAPGKAHKPGKPARRHSGGHARLSGSAGAGGVNTYGWQRQSGHGYVAPGYGTSYGPGYGYAGESDREGGYSRGYSSYDVQTYEYDSGWVPGTPGGPVPAPYGAGAGAYSSHYDSGWVRPGGAGPCSHPGAVMCLPPGHPPVGPMSYGYGGQGVSVGQELFYGGLAGGVAGPESYGGFPGGGGGVFIGSTTGGSAFASARAEAYASASAYSRGKAYGGRHGYKKH